MGQPGPRAGSDPASQPITESIGVSLSLQVSSGTGGQPGLPARSNAAAEWPAESDSDAGQSVSRAGQIWGSTGPNHVSCTCTFGPKADCRRDSSGPGSDDSWPKGANSKKQIPLPVPRKFITRNPIYRRYAKKQMIAIVLFDLPPRPGGSLPRGGPRRVAQALRSPAISHSTWSAPRPACLAGTPVAPQPP